MGVFAAPHPTRGAEKSATRESVTVEIAGHKISGGRDDHFLSFSGPIALPGTVLAAGTYIFTRIPGGVLLVSGTDRKPLAMINTNSVRRVTATDKYEVTFRNPAAEGAPVRLYEWYAPREQFGQQLIYR